MCVGGAAKGREAWGRNERELFWEKGRAEDGETGGRERRGEKAGARGVEEGGKGWEQEVGEARTWHHNHRICGEEEDPDFIPPCITSLGMIAKEKKKKFLKITAPQAFRLGVVLRCSAMCCKGRVCIRAVLWKGQRWYGERSVSRLGAGEGARCFSCAAC